MVLIPLILNYGINTNAMEIARFALFAELAAAACAALLVVYISGCNNELCNGLMFCMLLDHPMTLWI